MTENQTLPETDEVFAEPTALDALGTFFERFGLRRNVGRVWAVVYLSDRPIDQRSLQGSLDLSAGLISDALRELEHYGAVRTVSVPGERRTHYEAEARLLRIVANILAKRDLCAVRDLREAVHEARAHCETQAAKERLREIERVADLYEVLASVVVRAASLPIGAVASMTRALRDGALEPIVSGLTRRTRSTP